MVTPQAPATGAFPTSAVRRASKKQVPDKNLTQHGHGNKASISATPQPGNQHKLYTSVPCQVEVYVKDRTTNSEFRDEK